MPKFMFWIGLVFALIGTGMAIGAAYVLSANNELVSEGAYARGTVVDLEYIRSDEGGGTYAPVVKFVDAEGRTHTYRSSSSSNPPAYDRGERVDIYYAPETPERAMIDSFSDRWMLPLMMGVFVLAFGGAGYTILFFMVRRWKRVRWLQSNGAAIEARFERCFRDTSTKVNGGSPWRVEASGRHPVTRRKQSFLSDQIWVDLTEDLEGKSVKVLLDPLDDGYHYIDLREYLGDN